MQTTVDEVKKLLEKGTAPKEAILVLKEKGFSQEDIHEALQQVDVKSHRVGARIGVKELFDKVGFGFGSQQFVNIALSTMGASLLAIGLLNGMKVFFSQIFATLMNMWSKKDERLLSFSAILLGANFFLLGYAVFIHSMALFTLSILISSLSVVTYGDAYKHLVKSMSRVRFLEILMRYGIFLTVLVMLVAAHLLDIIKLPFGFYIVFAAAGTCFVFSALVALPLLQGKNDNATVPNSFSLLKDSSYFIKDKVLLVLTIAATITAALNTLGNAYYGIFIFENLGKKGFGGFLNVSIVFGLGLLVAFLVPKVTSRSSQAYGKFPMLLFGTLLMAMMPLSFYHNPNIVSVSIGTIIGIIGAGMVGTAQGLVALDSLKDDERVRFFNFLGAATVIAYLILIPLGSLLAYWYGMTFLFLLLVLALCLLVAPLYLLIVFLYGRKEPI